jgi:hypothetical protein
MLTALKSTSGQLVYVIYHDMSEYKYVCNI